MGISCRMIGPSEPEPTFATEPCPLAGLLGVGVPTAGCGLIWEPASAPTLPTAPWGLGGLAGRAGHSGRMFDMGFSLGWLLVSGW